MSSIYITLLTFIVFRCIIRTMFLNLWEVNVKRFIHLMVLFFLLTSLAMPILPARAATVNLITNPSVETSTNNAPDGWTSNAWGNNTTSFNYAADGHTGNKSLRIDTTAYTDGDAKWIANPAAVKATTAYTYTDYYKSSIATEIDLQYTDANGAVSYAYAVAVPAVVDWTPVSITFTTPASAVKVAPMHIMAGNGWLQTDDFDLSEVVPVIPPTSGNLITNPSFESLAGTNPAAWTTGKWGTNNAVFSTVATGAQDGTRSAKVQMTSFASGDAKWIFTPVAVTAGSAYTFSDYYSATVATSVVAQFDNGAGTVSYQDLGIAPVTASWNQFSVNLSVPAGMKNVTVLHLLNAVGSLQTDNYSLTPTVVTPPAPDANLFSNPSADTVNPSNPGQPQNWTKSSWGTNTPTFSYISTGTHSGGKALKLQITKYTDGDAKWVPDAVAVNGNSQFTFSDYYISTGVSRVYAAILMSNGTTVYNYLGATAKTTAWTQFSNTFSVPAGAVNVTVFHLLDGVNTLTTDDYSLKAYSSVGFSQALVSLTFDDGIDTIYKNGIPLLKKYSLASTQYIITSDIGKTGFVTQANIKAMQTAGHEIGSHTVTHPDLVKLTASQLSQEVANSKTTLQQLFGGTVTDFAAPYGSYNSPVTTELMKSYQTNRGITEGYNDKASFTPYDLKVQDVDLTTTTAEVQAWLNQASASHTWLILVFHGVSSTKAGADPYDVTTAQLDGILSTVKNSGMPVKTMAQAIAELTPQL